MRTLPRATTSTPNSHSRSTADPANDWADALERGAIIEADTLEELADKCGINKENFLATVARYNELVDAGKDEDFGVDSTFMTYNGIKEAPFYAIKRMPGLLCTAGGLTINEKLEVLNEAGEPLGGLYAAGNASGSYYGDDYPLFITGRLPRPRLDLRRAGGPLGPRPARRAGGHPGRLTVQRKGRAASPLPHSGAPHLTLPSRGPVSGPLCS